MERNILQTKEEYCNYFSHLWADSKPILKMFRTESRGYVYDTGTNRIFSCSDLEFALLNNLMKMDVVDALELAASLCPPHEFLGILDGIRTAVEEKDILKTKKAIGFEGAHFDNLSESIQNTLGMIQLEVTERCNLRCVYCIYNPHYKEKRNHGSRDMSLTTAYKAIDHLGRSSSSRGKVAVTFYGGEPLLCFPLIRSCVQYSRSVITKKDLGFSITTNATLMTPSIAKYFTEEGFSVHVSIDGPPDIHDEYRKDINGVGSFQRTISGLKMLYDAYGDKNEKITLSMVYAPPYTSERIDRVAELWSEYSWLSGRNGVTVTYPVGFYPPVMNAQNTNEPDFSLHEWARKKFIEDYQKGNKLHPIAAAIVEREMAKFVKRRIHSKSREKYCLNGCCVPSARKQFVSVDGTLIMCERIGIAPAIGNVDMGVDVERVNNIYVKEYAKESLLFCSKCWALQLCPVCYLHAFSKGRIDMQMKKNSCWVILENLAGLLTLYCHLMEINKTGLDYLAEWDFS